MSSEDEDNTKLKLKVAELMNSSVVTQVVEMGISEQHIRIALQQQLSSTGTAFSTATELFDAVQCIGDASAATVAPKDDISKMAAVSPS